MIDEKTHALVFSSWAHHKIHERGSFVVSDVQSVSTTTMKWQITTPDSEKYTHALFDLDGTGEMSVIITEGSDRTDGTALVEINRNRVGTTPSAGTIVTRTPTGGSTDGAITIFSIRRGIKMDKLLRITDMAKRAGVKPSTIRYYTDQGLLRPAKLTPGGHKLYDERETIARLKKIKGISEKPSLKEVKETLEKKHEIEKGILESVPDIKRTIKDVEDAVGTLKIILANIEKGSKNIPEVTRSTSQGIQEIRKAVNNIDKV
ncbi:hypothetical protein LCGC14_2539820, partial [marine sediment metagenome]